MTSCAFQNMIIEYFLHNKDSVDSEIHRWAASMMMTPEDLEGEIYKLLSELLGIVGFAYDTPDAAFDSTSLSQGIEEESKRTNNLLLAEMLAKGNLSRNPNYYNKQEIVTVAKLAEKAANRILSAIEINPENKGDLHKALGIPEGEEIPVSKLKEAVKSEDEHLRKMAQFALNARNFKH